MKEVLMKKENCENCENLKSMYKDGVNYALCPNAEKYVITCTVSKCPAYQKRDSQN